MIIKKLSSFLILSLFITIFSTAQEQPQSALEKIRQQQSFVGGTLSGKIRDEKSGDDLIGANVFIVDTKLGASTDIDGKYQIKKVPEGIYDVRISFLGYETKLITGVELTVGTQTDLDVSLSEDQGILQQEVVISASAIKSGEGAILAERKKAASIGDGISAEQIKRAPDATSSDALKRVPGVTIVDNKFVYVRGTSERYSNTTLNGTTISGAEPEKKSFSFDMFPSNLLENIVIAKTFTPDVSGDFAGGSVQLNTVEFPEYLTIRVGVSGGYNTETSTKSFQTYTGGSMDWLGMDDGARSIPNSVSPNIAKAKLTPLELQAAGQSFSNNWKTFDKKAPLNSGFDISIGNAFDSFGESQFGFIGALTYKNSFTRSTIERNDYDYDKPKFEYSGFRNNFSVLWGGMLNLSYKIDPFHKVSIKNVYNKTADDEVNTLEGINFDDGEYDRKTTALRFVERSVLSTQLMGEHIFVDLNAIQLQWRASNSESNRDEPDYRRYSYIREHGTDNPYQILMDFQASLRNGGRFYSELRDIVRNYGTDLTIPYGSIKFKIGGLYEDKDRQFNSRLLGFVYPFSNFDFNLLYYSIDSIFAPQNIKPNGYRIAEYSSGFNNYAASQNTAAYYMMTDIPFSFFDFSFRFIGGARVENADQKIATFDFDGITPIKGGKKTIDVLPSINFTWLLNDITNIRLAYSHTVNRPELRELAPFTYYDFNTQTSIYGNPNLQRALIKNYDIRFEIFPRAGELLSFSLFYKDMNDAIELASVPGSALGADRTYVNATRAKNLGYEIEFRQGLGIILDELENIAVTGNYSQVKSSVDVPTTGFGIGKSGRPLQGQSPYMINTSLMYSLPDYGFNASIMYNKFGERIAELATQYTEDIKEQPRNVMDITITKSITQNLEGKFSAKDIFQEAQRFTLGDKVVRSNSIGTTYSLSFAYKL